jgi:hypothetical protein
MGLGVVVLLLTFNVSAEPIVWALKDVTFASGGATLTGGFTYDPDVGLYGTYGSAPQNQVFGYGALLQYMSAPCFFLPNDIGGCGIDFDVPLVSVGATSTGTEFATSINSKEVQFTYRVSNSTGTWDDALDLSFATQLNNASGQTEVIAVSGYLSWDPYNDGTYHTDEIASGFVVGGVPEPESYALLLTGVGLLDLMARRRR